MGKMNQEEINVDLFDEVKRLKDELLEWETGQRQTSKDYNAYRERGIQLHDKDERIQELISLNLWSARRLNKVHKNFAYDELDKITGEKHDRLSVVFDQK